MAVEWEYGPFRSWFFDELDERQWNMKDLAKLMQPDNPNSMASSLSKWSRGIRQPDPASLERLAFVLGADLDYVLALGGHRRESVTAPITERERRAADIAAMVRVLPHADLRPVELLVRGLYDDNLQHPAR